MKTLRPNKIPILLVAGTVYFIFVFVLGASCYGTECIGLITFGTPIIMGSMPWGLLVDVFPEILPKKDGLLIYPFLEPSTWPGLMFVYLGFMFNLWLIGKVLAWLISRMKNTNI